jgi:hypothetical protein
MTGPNQVSSQTWPNRGDTNNWDTPLKTNVDAIRTAHNATDTAVADLAVVAGGKYVLPATGVPKSDLSSGVQTSLGKADSAIQALSYANALPGQRFDWPRQGGNWVVRPTTRADIFFDYRGSLPMPDGVAMQMLAGDAFVEEG